MYAWHMDTQMPACFLYLDFTFFKPIDNILKRIIYKIVIILLTNWKKTPLDDN